MGYCRNHQLWPADWPFLGQVFLVPVPELLPQMPREGADDVSGIN